MASLTGYLRRLLAWLHALRFNELHCGCPADGRPYYACIFCDYSRCAEHRYAPHDCPGPFRPRGPR